MNHTLNIILEIPDSFINWAFTQFPIIATCMTLIIMTGWIMWWARGLFGGYKTEFNKLQSDCSELKESQGQLQESQSRLEQSQSRLEGSQKRLERRQSRLERGQSRLESAQNRLQVSHNRLERSHYRLEKSHNQLVITTNAISRKLDELFTYLAATEKIERKKFRSFSPIQLTDEAMKMLTEMGGKKYIDTRLTSLLALIEKKRFHSALDVQNYSKRIFFDRIHDKELVPVRNFIFNYPMYKASDEVTIELDMPTAIAIMGIYLRDKYFEKHPELLLSGT